MARPSFQPTEEQRNDVRLMKVLDFDQETIAKQMGIDHKTLTKHFSEELRDGVNHIRKFVMQKLLEVAKKGNVAALKELSRISGASGAIEDFLKEPERVPRVMPKGRKEVQREDALNADPDGSWGSDLVPAMSRTMQ